MRAVLRGLVLVFRRVVAGDDDHRHTGAGLRKGALDLEAVDHRHAQVQHHAVGAALLQRQHELHARAEGLHFVARRADEPRQGLAHRLLIIDDHNERRVPLHAGTLSAAGRAANETLVQHRSDGTVRPGSGSFHQPHEFGD
jgi:hypothetical protein